MRFFPLLALTAALAAQEYRAPAGDRPAIRRPGAESILPGGRIINPLGLQFSTGPGPFALAVAEDGKRIATRDGGVDRYTLTVLEQARRDRWRTQTIDPGPEGSTTAPDDNDWRNISIGMAFASSKEVFVSEGTGGRVFRIDLGSGQVKETFWLNGGGWNNSSSGDLAYDARRKLLFVVDQANARLVLIDADRGRVVNSVPVGQGPSAVALSPDGNKAYVTKETQFLTVVNAANPAEAKVESLLLTGLPPGGVSGVAATQDLVFVSSAHDDSIAFLDPRQRTVVRKVDIRIPGLESLRGVIPTGMAIHQGTGWLFVAEAGINAIGVIETRTGNVVGHLPSAWFPSRIAINGDTVFVTAAKGQGTGPNAVRQSGSRRVFPGSLRSGTIHLFPVPGADELPRSTREVLVNSGLAASRSAPARLPAAIRHVVVITKGNRTYDEMLGDIGQASNGQPNGIWDLARFGKAGIIQSGQGLKQRLTLRNVNVTPNHHALAARFAFSDNFYADTEVNVEGDHWLLERGGLRPHLERHGVAFREYGFGAGEDDTAISDQQRATRFIADIDQRYVAGGEELPRLIYIRLPNDRTAPARPEDGYPFEASFVADNDLALGRIIEYLSKSKWWPNMAVFVTEDSARGGVDHVDSHRTVLLVASPYARRNYVSHTNASAPGLLKTVFRLLGIPPLNLFDASASDLAGCFTDEPDLSPYSAEAVNPDLFNPANLEAQQSRNNP